MSNEKETFDAQESLRIIRQTIDLAKQNVQENGFHFLLWGGLVVIASLAQWYLQNIAHYAEHYNVWMIMVIVGLPLAVIYEWRKGEKKMSSTILNRWYGQIWMGFGISLLIVIPLSVTHQTGPIPFILVLAAFATFLSGVVLQFRPLLYGGVALWAGAVVCYFLPGNHHALVEAVAIFLGYIIPGISLNRESRKTYAQRS